MSIDLLNPTHPTIRYFGANRCINDDEVKSFNQRKITCDEIVSFDCGLLEMYEIDNPDAPLRSDTEQIVAVIFRPDLEPAIYPEGIGFTFCGYDLVEDATAISAITDCGAMFKSIPYERLTEYGLLPTYKDAVLTQLALVEEDPCENHAYCMICEIWRKLV
ncbi:MAG: hypothetical protein IJY39_13805 [Clostridia bacterium]|nr:hypothetical protein [Clostridia bacterium]